MHFSCEQAGREESQAGSGIRRQSPISRRSYAGLRTLRCRIGHRHRRNQCQRIGMPWIIADRLAISPFRDAAQVPNGTPVHHLPHDSKIMANEDHCHPEICLQALQERDNLRLNRSVQRRASCIADHKSRPVDHCPCDSYTLIHHGARAPAPDFCR